MRVDTPHGEEETALGAVQRILRHHFIQEGFGIEGSRREADKILKALSSVSETTPRDAGAAWDAAIEEAAREVESHWNHIDAEVNQCEQAKRSAAAIRRLKRTPTGAVQQERKTALNPQAAWPFPVKP